MTKSQKIIEKQRNEKESLNYIVAEFSKIKEPSKKIRICESLI